MALTILQNCQRAVAMLELLAAVLSIVFLTVKIIKKRVDPRRVPEKQEEPSDSANEKYKEEEVTHVQFDKTAVHALALQDEDTCTERLMKKISQFDLEFHPILMGLPLCFVLGRSMPFSIAIYLMALVSCWLFNCFKVHRACIEHKLTRMILEIIWGIMAVLLFVNLWTTKPSTMPYLLVS